MPGYRISSYSLENRDEIKDEWLLLQANSDCSFFQSWGWIGTWLEIVVADLKPQVLKVYQEDQLVGLGIFISRSIHRHLVIDSNAYFLHEYPFNGRNMVIEYNGMLSLQDHKINVYRAAISYLFEKGPEMDEIFFGAVSESERFDELNDPAWSVKLLESSPAWSLELGGLASGIDAYLSTLSKNRRGQIRRSFKLFERQGPLLLQVAKNVAEALDYFEGLKQLHTIRWNRDGKPGSFANLRWEAFHRSLISSRAPEGDIHLIKVSIGQEAIGFLYNLIWRDRVYVLQTGFRQYDDKRLMPGYVVHLLAIEHYVKLGLHVYDLMHGDSLYKRILCNRKERLNWYSVQRNRWKFVLEDSAVGLVRAVRGKFTT